MNRPLAATVLLLRFLLAVVISGAADGARDPVGSAGGDRRPASRYVRMGSRR
jgi:hypothetical protein